MLTCRDVEELVDAFVDTELPSHALLDVAAHGQQCSKCQAQIQSLTVLGHMVGVTVRDDAATLDLSGVWAAVERRIDRRIDGAAQPPQPVALVPATRWPQLFRGPALPAWGTVAMIAASAVLYLRPTTQMVRPVADGTAPRPTVALARAAMNHALVDRIKVGKGGIADVRRIPKDGTTAIWVNYSPDGPQ